MDCLPYQSVCPFHAVELVDYAVMTFLGQLQITNYAIFLDFWWYYYAPLVTSKIGIKYEIHINEEDPYFLKNFKFFNKPPCIFLSEGSIFVWLCYREIFTISFFKRTCKFCFLLSRLCYFFVCRYFEDYIIQDFPNYAGFSSTAILLESHA